MTNERLRSAISKAGLTVQELSDKVQVDPKTIERWIDSGRTPHRQNRQRLARCVGADEVYLWPDALPETQIQSASVAEVVEVYPNRGALPAGLWHSLLAESVECIDVLAFAATFMHDTLADFSEIVADRADQGVRVRFLLGDPESAAVATGAPKRGSETSCRNDAGSRGPTCDLFSTCQGSRLGSTARRSTPPFSASTKRCSSTTISSERPPTTRR